MLEMSLKRSKFTTQDSTAVKSLDIHDLLDKNPAVFWRAESVPKCINFVNFISNYND